MLGSLHVENIALIRSCDIELDGGLTVLTGETGAGKSLLVDSLCLLCGAKSDRTVIRTGESYALVEGVFYGVPDSAVELLAAEDINVEDGEVVLMRRISADGRSTARICGRAVTVSKLREVASHIITIHGQQDTQTLADRSRQLYMLDRRAGDSRALCDYQNIYYEAKALRERINTLQNAADERAERIDMLDYRIAELQKLGIKRGEEDELIAEKARIQSFSTIVTHAAEAHGKLSTVSGKVGAAISAIEPLFDVVPETKSLSDRLYNIMYEAEDITETLSSYLGDGDGEEDRQKRLDNVQDRLMTINTLKRRYRVTSADMLIDKLEAMQAERSELDRSDELLTELAAEYKTLQAKLFAAADELSAQRKTAAETLKSEVLDSLRFLDMPSVRFEIQIDKKEPSLDGSDDICFMISANKGEELRQMSKIASGGELSRIMLAVARALECGGADGTLIFDEIDTGISGSTSDKIGMLLSQIAEGGQVICVTHSAQIASRADRHLLISKRETDGRTSTAIKSLDREGRINELARILGGVNVGRTTISAAEEMLDNAQHDTI